MDDDKNKSLIPIQRQIIIKEKNSNKTIRTSREKCYNVFKVISNISYAGKYKI